MKENFLIKKNAFFNPDGDIKVDNKRIINGNSTNINDYSNIKYTWVSNFYRQAMNNFWVPEEINLNKDVKEYRKKLTPAEKRAYDKILSFLIFLDSIQSSNVSNFTNYVTSSEINLCFNIQAFQETIHSQAYSYILDNLCSPSERDKILYQWKEDQRLLNRNKFISEKYDLFLNSPTKENFIKALVANYILEGIYFYSGFVYFYNLGRNEKMEGSVNLIKLINRDENSHLALIRNIILELQKEEKKVFDDRFNDEMRKMIFEACKQEIEWGLYVIGNDIQGLTDKMIIDYIMYLGNLRTMNLNLKPIFQGHLKEPESMSWVSKISDTNIIKADFFSNESAPFIKNNILKDDL